MSSLFLVKTKKKIKYKPPTKQERKGKYNAFTGVRSVIVVEMASDEMFKPRASERYAETNERNYHFSNGVAHSGNSFHGNGGVGGGLIQRSSLSNTLFQNSKSSGNNSPRISTHSPQEGDSVTLGFSSVKEEEFKEINAQIPTPFQLGLMESQLSRVHREDKEDRDIRFSRSYNVLKAEKRQLLCALGSLVILFAVLLFTLIWMKINWGEKIYHLERSVGQVKEVLIKQFPYERDHLESPEEKRGTEQREETVNGKDSSADNPMTTRRNIELVSERKKEQHEESLSSEQSLEEKGKSSITNESEVSNLGVYVKLLEIPCNYRGDYGAQKPQQLLVKQQSQLQSRNEARNEEENMPTSLNVIRVNPNSNVESEGVYVTVLWTSYQETLQEKEAYTSDILNSLLHFEVCCFESPHYAQCMLQSKNRDSLEIGKDEETGELYFSYYSPSVCTSCKITLTLAKKKKKQIN